MTMILGWNALLLLLLLFWAKGRKRPACAESEHQKLHTVWQPPVRQSNWSSFLSFFIPSSFSSFFDFLQRGYEATDTDIIPEWYHTWGQLIARAWNGNLVNGKRVKPTSQFCALFHCSRWLLFPSKDLLYCSRGLNSTTDNFYVSPLYNTGNPRWFTRNCFKNTTKKRQNYYRRLK